MDPTIDRYIRVFVSSTFRDMQAERNHLVKFIFPQLRKLCESRGVTWGEVDLRWGIPDEDKDAVLPLCLEEIQRCQYFIGLLGEYYGSVPEAIRDDLIEQHPWLHDHRHKSITELEILYGVLRDEKMHRGAFFYFRDPGYLQRLPEGSKRENFESESPKVKEHLEQLKASIRHAQKKLICQLRELYSGPEQLGQWILEDLTKLLDELFPVTNTPDAIEHERFDHEAFGLNRARIYIRRQEHFDQLDAHVAGDGRPLVVLGESGVGKSALLANWFFEYQKKYPDTFSLIHFIGATPDSADSVRLLLRIMSELKHRFPDQLPEATPAHPEKIREEFPIWLTRVAGSNKIVLILDSLNQLEDRDTEPDLAWLPTVLPPNCRLILSTLPGRSLEATRHRQWRELTVQPLTVPERRQLLERFLAQYSRRLSPVRVERIVSANQTANPLFLRAMLDELRQFGDNERLSERIEHYLATRDLRELYERIIERWEQDFGQDIICQALSLIWAARRGLSEAELLDLLGKDDQPLPRAVLTPFSLATETSLTQRSGLLSFSHNHIREAVSKKYLLETETQIQTHLRLADYFSRNREADLYQLLPWPFGRNSPEQTITARRVEELPYQLIQVESWKRLFELVSDYSFFIVAWNARPSEVVEIWRRLEAKSDFSILRGYDRIIHDPTSLPDFAWRIAGLLQSTGYLPEASGIWQALGGWCKQAEHLQNAISCFLIQAQTLRKQGQLEQAINLVCEAEAMALIHGLRDCQAMCFREKGVTLLAANEFDQALAQLKQAESIAEELGLRNVLADCWSSQASVLNAGSMFNEAYELLQQAGELYRSLGDWQSYALALANQARVLLQQTGFEEALQMSQQAVAVARQSGSRSALASCLATQGLVCMGRGAEAIRAFETEEQILRELRDLRELVRCLGDQAGILEEMGSLPSALAKREEQKALCCELNDGSGFLKSLDVLFQRYYNEGKLDQALTAIEEAEQFCRSIRDDTALQITLTNHAKVLYALGKFETAVSVLEESEALCRSQCNDLTLAECLGTQALVAKGRGHFERAWVLLKRQEEVCRTANYLPILGSCLCYQANVAMDQGNFEEAHSLYEQAEQLCRQCKDPRRLAVCLVNKAILLAKKMDRCREGSPIAREAYQLALQEGLQVVARQMRPILEHIEEVLNSSSRELYICGDALEAGTVNLEQLAVCRQLGDPIRLATCLTNRAILYLQALARPKDALGFIEEAYTLVQRHGLRHIASDIEEVRRVVDSELGRRDKVTVDDPNPSANKAPCPRSTMQWQQALASSEALPWWKRWFMRKPKEA